MPTKLQHNKLDNFIRGTKLYKVIKKCIVNISNSFVSSQPRPLKWLGKTAPFGYFFANSRRAGITSVVSLFVVLGFSLICTTPDTYAAASLSISVDSASESFDLLPTASSAAFGKSGTITASITTTNYTGYNFTITGPNASKTLVGTTSSSNTLESIASAIAESTFSSSSDYDNKWGFLPSKLNGSANSNYQPGPLNTTATVIDTTNVANSTANTYSFAIAAKVANSVAKDTYSGSFELTTVANSPAYQITYDANGGDNPPSVQSGTLIGDTVTLSATEPTRDGYNFLGWCSTTPIDATCSNPTTPIAAGGQYTFAGVSDTGLNAGTLYAVWENVEATKITLSNINEYFTIENGSDYYFVPSNEDDPVFTSNNKSNNGTTATTTLTLLSEKLVSFTWDASLTAPSSFSVTVNGVKVVDVPGYSNKQASFEEILPANSTIVFAFLKDKDDFTLAGVSAKETASFYDLKVDSPPTTYDFDVTYFSTRGTVPSSQSGNSYKVRLADAMPLTDGYSFRGWCTVDTNGGNTCPGTKYSGRETVYVGSSTSLNLYAMWEGALYLQDISTWKARLSNVGDTITAVDSRDNKEYTVGKLADNKIWMLDNLAFSDISFVMASQNTNVNTSVSLTSAGEGNANAGTWYYNGASYTKAIIKTTNEDVVPSEALSTEGEWKIGVYYNYCAASAGTKCTKDNTSDIQYDICPAGWRLPTGNTNGEFQALYTAIGGPACALSTSSGCAEKYEEFRTILRLPLGGSVGYTGSASNITDQGLFWSSTSYGLISSNNFSYILGLTRTTVLPTTYTGNYAGANIRCIAK